MISIFGYFVSERDSRHSERTSTPFQWGMITEIRGWAIIKVK
jgi:hypothetical protein